MGNTFSPCLTPDTRDTVKLVIWGGATRLLPEVQIAGRLMSEFPDHVICHADAFYIGQPVPAVGTHDQLLTGSTYFVIPVDRLPCHILTVASLSALPAGGSRRSQPVYLGQRPFKYTRGVDGQKMIKVVPEFISKIISEGSHRRHGSGGGGGRRISRSGGGGGGSHLCSTPELQKQYAQLVGTREQQWSPKLETISECKASVSPCRLLGLHRR